MPQARRRPTSADVAARAGVSRTTVSFVLNGRADVQIPLTTWRRVEEAARELGYHPHGVARQLAAGSSSTLGVVLRQSAEQVAADALLSETLLGLTTAARSGGFRVIIEPLAPGTGTYAELLRSQQTDGLVVSGPLADDGELSDLVSDGFPIVLQGSQPQVDAPSVDVDNRAGAQVAVEHLIGLGHRRIACITNAPLAYTSAVQRVAGYRDALAAAGIEIDEGLIVEGGFDAASGHRAMAGLLARAQPTAVFVASDVVAFGALRALRDAGRRVPADVSIVGFDDIPLAEHFDPPLTTLRLPARALGVSAGQALIDRVAGRPVPPRTLLPTQLIVRESTAHIGTRQTGGP
ncbi:MAG: LacI family transcriptional regulator [Chloroflexi bacterium]|nr:MAG: LacI family transcriptional regulator [Chloroflexota bacterium]